MVSIPYDTTHLSPAQRQFYRRLKRSLDKTHSSTWHAWSTLTSRVVPNWKPSIYLNPALDVESGPRDLWWRNLRDDIVFPEPDFSTQDRERWEYIAHAPATAPPQRTMTLVADIFPYVRLTISPQYPRDYVTVFDIREGVWAFMGEDLTEDMKLYGPFLGHLERWRIRHNFRQRRRNPNSKRQPDKYLKIDALGELVKFAGIEPLAGQRGVWRIVFKPLDGYEQYL